MLNYDKLKARLAEVNDLRAAAAVLAWDQQTYMPSGGGPARAEQLATLQRLAHEMFIAKETGDLLEASDPEVTNISYDADESSLVRVVRRDYEKARKVPPQLVAELARASSEGLEVWTRARMDSDFPAFEPSLQRMLELQQQLAENLGYSECPYDALLDQYEEGMTVSVLTPLFDQLKAGLVPLVRASSERHNRLDNSLLRRHFEAHRQWDFGLEVLKQFGFDFNRGRQDKSVHPFTTSFSVHDVRITTRVDEEFLPSALFGTIHECGHALYEQGVSPSLDRTPLAGGTSLGVHESQSRLWENLIGRSRSFWKFFYPRLQQLFSGSLSDICMEEFYRAINQVQPTLIRVEADEVTYNLHILLRMELEIQLLDRQLRVKDLPEAWNHKMEAYLGIIPPNDAAGVLQDIHWAEGLIGYFPTYTLGNMLSVQLFDKARLAIAGLESQIEVGEFGKLLEWLRNAVHHYGRKLQPAELVERATGGPLRAEPYLGYLKTKYGEIYGIR